ncbi:MAG: DUF3800 domain-containing protein [bacterium]
MHYLYLDESGDLGHHMPSPGASRHFVIAVLEVIGDINRKVIEKAVARTLKNKLHKKHSQKKKSIVELKATMTDLADKQYFYRHVAAIPFTISTVILKKDRFANHLELNKNRVYRFIANLVLKQLPLEQATTRVTLTLDKSMRSAAIQEFNAHAIEQLESHVPPRVLLTINHGFSHEDKLLQAIDLFVWGIFRKYETGDMRWYEIFKEKIVFERVYPDK